MNRTESSGSVIDAAHDLFGVPPSRLSERGRVASATFVNAPLQGLNAQMSSRVAGGLCDFAGAIDGIGVVGVGTLDAFGTHLVTAHVTLVLQ